MFEEFKFEEKYPGLSKDETQKISTFLSEEIKDGEIDNGSVLDYKQWNLPLLKIPEQYLKLLSYSNGGLIVNGNREFGFFGKNELREYYLNYEFPHYMPGVLPIALNGGGVFYAYDLRKTLENPQIIAVGSGALDWKFAYSLGNDLLEMLSKTTNIEDEEP